MLSKTDVFLGKFQCICFGEHKYDDRFVNHFIIRITIITWVWQVPQCGQPQSYPSPLGLAQPPIIIVNPNKLYTLSCLFSTKLDHSIIFYLYAGLGNLLLTLNLNAEKLKINVTMSFGPIEGGARGKVKLESSHRLRSDDEPRCRRRRNRQLVEERGSNLFSQRVWVDLGIHGGHDSRDHKWACL